MKPSILVLYFTQTGQLKQILQSVLGGSEEFVDTEYVEIKPLQPFPFPWTAATFFDAMPETVLHQPRAIAPLPPHLFQKNYDLVVLGYQPWFLNPSQPISALLQSDGAKLLGGKKVLTVVGSRNMWLHAQETIKEYLIGLQATLVGNIVLTDSNPNLISLLTVIRWSFSGQKEAKGLLPAAGVQAIDIQRAARFGAIIYRHLHEDNLIDLHRALMAAGSVKLKPGLVILEQRGIRNFRKWAKYISEKGGPGAQERLPRVKLFKNLLLTAIFILSPISSITAALQLALQRTRLKRDVAYYMGLDYEKNRL